MKPIVWLLVLLFSVCCFAEGIETQFLTNETGSTLKNRTGFLAKDDRSSLGFVSEYYVEEQSSPWGFGGYAKYYVDPNMVIPVGGWFDGITENVPDWLANLIQLPETVQAKSYLVGEFVLSDWSEDVGIVGRGATGLSFWDTFCFEYAYQLVDGGETDRGNGGPLLSSGPYLYFGLGPFVF